MHQRPRRILPVIVVSQLAATSLWFAGNAVLPDLQSRLGLPDSALGHMTSAVQLGFIAGTLVFALLAVSDRYSPRATFLACALLGAACNASALLAGEHMGLLLGTRFATGFFLAGIYPVGMKIASGWYRHDLGRALGFLVGALVFGTALPHLIRGLGQSMPWETVMLSVSAIAVAGGVGDVRAGAGRAVPGRRREVRSARAGDRVPVTRVPCLLVRILRAHVGALRVLGLRAAAGRRACGTLGRAGGRHLAHGVRRDRRRRRRLRCGRPSFAALRQRARARSRSLPHQGCAACWRP